MLVDFVTKPEPEGRWVKMCHDLFRVLCDAAPAGTARITLHLGVDEYSSAMREFDQVMKKAAPAFEVKEVACYRVYVEYDPDCDQ